MSMKKLIDPFDKYQQAINYRLLNMKKLKLYLMKDEQRKEEIEELEEMKKKNRKFVRDLKDRKIERFKSFYDELDYIFDNKIYIDKDEKKMLIEEF